MVPFPIKRQLDVPWCTLLSMDSFYKVLTPVQHEAAAINEYNFDHPDAFDFPLLIETLTRLTEYKEVKVPIYNFVTHKREDRWVKMYGANVILFEGIFAFHDPKVRSMLNMKIFVDTDSDIRLCRRLIRDTGQRGRSFKSVIEQHQRHVQPAFKFFIEKTMIYADIIVPRGGENEVAIDLVVQHVRAQLQAKGGKLREELLSSHLDHDTDLQALTTLHVLPKTPQIIGLLTQIRCHQTPRDEFTFYSKRLIRILIEHSLSLMPFEHYSVNTPQGITYSGRSCPEASKVCGVSIICGGEPLEDALKECCKDVRVGKILIQTNQNTREPELYYLKLPNNIKDYRVILMDCAVATGAAGK